MGEGWGGGGGAGGEGLAKCAADWPIQKCYLQKERSIFICIINVQTRTIDKTYNATTRYSLSHTDSRKLFKAAFSFFV